MLSNQIALVLFFLTSGSAIHYIDFQMTAKLHLFCGLLYLSVLILNFFNLNQASRIYFGFIAPVIIVITGSVVSKEIAMSYKFPLLASIILPLILFGISEKYYMIIGSIWIVICFLAFDTVSDFIPYFKEIDAVPLGSANTFMFSQATFSLLVLFLGFYHLQRINYKAEEELNRLLNHAHHQNSFIFEQNQELQGMYKAVEDQKLKLESQNKELIALNDEKNHLIGIVAHDLRSPLNHIKGLISIIQLTSTNLNDEQLDLIIKISDATGRLTDLISRILDVNAIESKKNTSNIERINLKDSLEEVIGEFKPSADQKEIDLIVQASDSYAEVDKNFMKQVLENLISNAIKFSPHQKSIITKSYTNDSKVRIEVEDQGPGLNEEDKKKLFGKFQKLSAQPTAGEQSTGIGLFSVKKFVEEMQGKVWCESEQGKGAKFIVEFDQANT